MKFIAIFPILCAFIALILSFLCIFAGSKTGYLESYDIVTVNTSRIAVDLFKQGGNQGQDHSDSDDGFFGSAFHDIGDELHHLAHEVENKIEHALNDGLASFAAVIGLHDFYSVHVLDFCEGFFSPEGTSQKNVTGCSNSQGLFSFNPRVTLERELKESGLGVSLSDLHWPSAIDEALDGLKLAFNVMFVLYCLGIALIGLAFFASIAGLFLDKRSIALGNIFLTQSAFFALMVASAIVTGAANEATHVINKYGEEISINATRGDNLIKLTWTATLLMFFASMVWLVDLLLARRKAKKLDQMGEK